MSNRCMDMDCSCQGKYLDKMLQPNILMILSKGPLHGFRIIQELSQSPMFSGMEPDRTGVYRYLKRMEEGGLLTSVLEKEEGMERKRRVFSITEKGRECFNSWDIVLKQYMVQLAGLIRQMDEEVKHP